METSASFEARSAPSSYPTASQSGAFASFREAARNRQSILFGLDQRNFAGGNFTQGRDDFLVIGFDQRTRTLEELLGAPRSSQHQLETIRNDFEAIFHSDSRHYESIVRLYPDLCQRGVRRGRRQAGGTLLFHGQTGLRPLRERAVEQANLSG